MSRLSAILFMLLAFAGPGSSNDSKPAEPYQKKNFVLVYPITSFLLGGLECKYERRLSAIPMAFSATFNFGSNHGQTYFNGDGFYPFYDKSYLGLGGGVHYFLNREVKGHYFSINFMAQDFHTTPNFNENVILKQNDEYYSGHSQTYQITILWSYRFVNTANHFVTDIGLGAIFSFSSGVEAPRLDIDYADYSRQLPPVFPTINLSLGFCF